MKGREFTSSPKPKSFLIDKSRNGNILYAQSHGFEYRYILGIPVAAFGIRN